MAHPSMYIYCADFLKFTLLQFTILISDGVGEGFYGALPNISSAICRLLRLWGVLRFYVLCILAFSLEL